MNRMDDECFIRNLSFCKGKWTARFVVWLESIHTGNVYQPIYCIFEIHGLPSTIN